MNGLSNEAAVSDRLVALRWQLPRLDDLDVCVAQGSRVAARLRETGDRVGKTLHPNHTMLSEGEHQAIRDSLLPTSSESTSTLVSLAPAQPTTIMRWRMKTRIINDWPNFGSSIQRRSEAPWIKRLRF